VRFKGLSMRVFNLKFSLKMRTRFIFSILLAILSSIIISCRQVHTYNSQAIIVSRSIDSTLNDSVLIYGYVLSAGDELTPEINANVWIDSTSIETKSDNSGFFKFKTTSGTYTIKGLGEYSSREFIIELKNLSTLPNEKVELKLLQGIVVE
jgi:hypothetical protein